MDIPLAFVFFPGFSLARGADLLYAAFLIEYNEIKCYTEYFVYTVNRSRHKVKYDTQYDKAASSEGQ
jgi:hypothetical protein